MLLVRTPHVVDAETRLCPGRRSVLPLAVSLVVEKQTEKLALYFLRFTHKESRSRGDVGGGWCQFSVTFCGTFEHLANLH